MASLLIPIGRLAVLLSLLGAGTPVVRAEAQIQVIVHPSTPDSSISMPELARLFRGEVALLPGGERVRLVEQSTARDTFYERVVRMSEDQFRRHWIRVVFAGNAVTPPVGFESAADAVRFVAGHRGALAFVEGPVDASVKVLLVDGRHPGDPSYPLR
jgi:hypothetical protein